MELKQKKKLLYSEEQIFGIQKQEKKKISVSFENITIYNIIVKSENILFIYIFL